MAAGTTPIFPTLVKTWYGQVATANANRDGSGTLATIATGDADGSRVDRIRIKATVTTTAGMVRFFISLDGGTTKRMVLEKEISAITVSATVAGFSADITTPDLYLPDTSAVLYASTEKAEAINIVACGGDY